MDLEITKLRKLLPTINGQSTLLLFKTKEKELQEIEYQDQKRQNELMNPIQGKINALIDNYDNLKELLENPYIEEKASKYKYESGLKRISSKSLKPNILKKAESSKAIIHARPPTTPTATSNFFYFKRKKVAVVTKGPTTPVSPLKNDPKAAFFKTDEELNRYFLLSGNSMRPTALGHDTLSKLQKNYLKNLPTSTTSSYFKAEQDSGTAINTVEITQLEAEFVPYAKKQGLYNMLKDSPTKSSSTTMIKTMEQFPISTTGILANSGIQAPPGSSKPKHSQFGNPTVQGQNQNVNTVLFDGNYLAFQNRIQDQNQQGSPSLPIVKSMQRLPKLKTSLKNL